MNKQYANIKDEKEMSLVDQLKYEFRCRYGVDISVDINIHNVGTNKISKEIAKYIIDDWSKEPHNHEPEEEDYGWFNNSKDYDTLDLPSVCVFYDK